MHTSIICVNTSIPTCSSPTPSLNSLGCKLDQRLRKRNKLLTVKRVVGGGGAKSYDGEKAGPLYIIKYSLLPPLSLQIERPELNDWTN